MASATTLNHTPGDGVRGGMMPSSARPPDLIREAAEQLIAGSTAILLIGSSVQTSTALGDLLAHTRATVGNRLQPVRFPAATGTPALLRDVVGRAYEARPDPATRLLIVVAQADALSPETLQEFELAAEAASVHGGLQFLFTSVDDVALVWKRDSFFNLSASLKYALHLVTETDEPGLLATYGLLDAPKEGETWPAEPPRRGYRVRIVVAILATLALIALVAAGIAYQRHVPLSGLLAALTAPQPPASLRPVMASPVQAPVTAPPPAQAPSSREGGVRTVPRTPHHTSIVRPGAQPAIRLSVTEPGAPFAAAPVASIPLTQIAPPAPAASVIPGASLLLIAGPGDTLASLYAKVYRGMTPPPYSEVTAVNPATIRPGDHLMFPTPPGGWRP